MRVLSFCPPLYSHVPAHVGSYGPEVADLAESAGMTLDPEQRMALDVMYAHDARGRLVCAEFGAAAPRQNLKTHVAKAAALADLVLFDESDALWTAHLRSTSDKSAAELVDLFENYDHLRRLVDSTPSSDGELAIVLRRPAAGEPHPTLTFMARSERGGRGLTGRKVTYDEALFLKPTMTAAMVPILSAQSMSGLVQLRYLGSPGLLQSQVWRDVRDRGRAGDAARLGWLEWAAPVTPCEVEHCQHEVGARGCALDREDLVRVANLAIDRRMDIEFVLGTERQALTPADFMRERFGWWQDPLDAGGGIFGDRWAGLADPKAERGSSQVFAVATAPDRSWTAIGVAWNRPDGAVQVMLADYRPGNAWVKSRLVELRQAWGGVVVADTASRGLIEEAHEPSKTDQAEAHNAFYDLVMADRVRHGNERALNTAVRGSRWRDLGGDTRQLDRKGDTENSPLVAVGLAAWALLTLPPAGPPEYHSWDDIERLADEDADDPR